MAKMCSSSRIVTSTRRPVGNGTVSSRRIFPCSSTIASSVRCMIGPLPVAVARYIVHDVRGSWEDSAAVPRAPVNQLVDSGACNRFLCPALFVHQRPNLSSRWARTSGGPTACRSVAAPVRMTLIESFLLLWERIKAKRKLNCLTHCTHVFWFQVRNKSTKLSFRDCLKIIRIHSTCREEAISLGQDNFSGDATDCGRNRRNR